jgi:hypothetical protein
LPNCGARFSSDFALNNSGSGQAATLAAKRTEMKPENFIVNGNVHTLVNGKDWIAE